MAGPLPSFLVVHGANDRAWRSLFFGVQFWSCDLQKGSRVLLSTMVLTSSCGSNLLVDLLVQSLML